MQHNVATCMYIITGTRTMEQCMEGILKIKIIFAIY